MRDAGEVEKLDQYYHRYVVALLIGPLLAVVVGIEPVRNKQTRIGSGEKNVDTDEGELTTAHRLLGKLHTTYGTFIDAFVFDGLYPNGPLLTKLTKLKYGALIVLRKEDNEPLKDALALWQGQPPCKVVDDPETKEHIEYWDIDELETLDTYNGKIRVIRAEVTKTGPRPTTSTWCAGIIGERPRRLSVGTALKAVRARWHIENTAYAQLSISRVMCSTALCGVAWSNWLSCAVFTALSLRIIRTPSQRLDELVRRAELPGPECWRHDGLEHLQLLTGVPLDVDFTRLGALVAEPQRDLPDVACRAQDVHPA